MHVCHLPMVHCTLSHHSQLACLAHVSGHSVKCPQTLLAPHMTWCHTTDAIVPAAFVHLAMGTSESASPMLQIILHIALIRSTIRICHSAMSLLDAIVVAAYVHLAVRPGVSALPRSLVVFPSAFIYTPINTPNLALPMPLAVLLFSNVDISIGVCDSALFILIRCEL